VQSANRRRATASHPTLSHHGKSTATRLVSSLVRFGFLQRETLSRRYSPGPALVSLGASSMKLMGVVRAARGQMEAIHQETGESVTVLETVENSSTAPSRFIGVCPSKGS
jgi:DNA-binding IclR family transcriptional regulator